MPETPAVPVPMKLPFPVPPMLAHAGLVDIVVVGEVAGESVGIVGATGLGLTVLPAGKTLGSGTAGVELTPRLPISNDPNGIPVRALPPGAVGAVGAPDVGADDAARLLEPAPHIPDIPDVSSVPEDAELAGISDVNDVAEVDVADIAVVPEFVAVAGAAAPTPTPPPSKLAVEPNISEGEVAAPVEHCVLVVAVGIVIVPVMPPPLGAGLSPGEVISVEPSGIPVGEPADPVATPSGEVAPIIGVGVTVPPNSSPTCAMAMLLAKSTGRTIAINEILNRILRFAAISLAIDSTSTAHRSIAPIWRRMKFRKRSAAADVQRFIQFLVELLLSCVEVRKFLLLGLARRRISREAVRSRLQMTDRRLAGN